MKSIILVPLLAASAFAEPVSLFNDKDLTGWTADVPEADKKPDLSPSFIVRDGNLVSLGKPLGHLVTDDDGPGARSLVRLGPDDMFAQGTAEAYAQGWADAQSREGAAALERVERS